MSSAVFRCLGGFFWANATLWFPLRKRLCSLPFRREHINTIPLPFPGATAPTYATLRSAFQRRATSAEPRWTAPASFPSAAAYLIFILRRSKIPPELNFGAMKLTPSLSLTLKPSAAPPRLKAFRLLPRVRFFRIQRPCSFPCSKKRIQN